MLVGVSRALKAARQPRPNRRPGTQRIADADGRAMADHIESRGRRQASCRLTSRRADYDEARAIDEDEARAMARRLAREEGIFAGTSSGLNVVAALQLAASSAPAVASSRWRWTPA